LIMKIFIIGSKGFIGSHLITTMLTQNFDVIKIDSSSDKHGTGQRSRIVEILKINQPDVCINCSGAAHVPRSFDAPFNDFEKNTIMVYEILDAIRIHSPHTRFVHLSSAAVYGNPRTLPITETAPTMPISPYGFHKLAAEKICQEFTQLYGLKTISLRIFSAYGPGLRKQLIWDSYQKWKQSPVVELFGSGDETRDFIFITDLCEAIITIIRNGDFNGNSINIASGISTSIRDIVTMLIHELGENKEIHFIDKKRTGDPDCWCADVRSLNELGFKIKTPLKIGVRTTAKWQKEHG